MSSSDSQHTPRASPSHGGSASSVVGSVEYQAIILATAVGSSLFPLTSESGGEQGESIGRSVLPIANRPLLWYQMDMIHKAGFPSVIVVTRDTMRKSVQRALEEWRVARGGSAHGVNVSTAPADPHAAAAASTAAAAASSSSSSSGPAHSNPSSVLASLTSANTANTNATNSSTASGTTIGGGARLLDIDLVSLDRYLGSADALRRLAPRLHTDFFVLGGDLVSNLPFQNLADLARAQDAGVVVAVSEDADSAGLDAKEKKKAEAEAAAAGVDKQYFGIDAASQRLLLFKTQADVEEKLEVSKRLLAAHPKFTLHTRIKDAHLYLFSVWILYFLREKPNIVSIQSELIPCLVAGQFKRKYAEWRAYGKNTSQSLALRMSHAPRKEIEQTNEASAGGGGAAATSLAQPMLNRGDTVTAGATTGGATTTTAGGGAPATTPSGGPAADNFQESFRLFVYPLSANTFCLRANTLAHYKSLNHELCSDREYAYMPWPSVAGENAAERLAKQYGAQTVAIGRETIIGEGTTFTGGEVAASTGAAAASSAGGAPAASPSSSSSSSSLTTTIKRSCIGRGCTIGARVKLHGCIVMDHVTIADGCTLTDCLISSHSVIGANSVLKECKVAARFRVAAGTEGKNEIMCDEEE